MAKEKSPAPKRSEMAREMLARDRAKYEAAKERFEKMEDELRASFPKILDEGLSDEEREALTLSDSIPEIAQIVLDKYDQLVTEPIKVEREALDEVENRLKEKEFALELLSAEEAFAEAHPEVDIDAFARFLQEELSPAQLRKITEESGGDVGKHFELAYSLFSEKNGKGPEGEKKGKEPDLDTDLSGVAGEAGDIDGDGPTDADEDFLDLMGLNR